MQGATMKHSEKNFEVKPYMTKNLGHQNEVKELLNADASSEVLVLFSVKFTAPSLLESDQQVSSLVISNNATSKID